MTYCKFALCNQITYYYLELIKLEDNRGFNCCELIERGDEQLRIGIIDADLLDNGTRHPNLALLKISGYCKHFGHDVRLIQDYDEVIKNNQINFLDFDLLVMSRVFKFTKIPFNIKLMIQQGFICYGGTGFFEINGPVLPAKVEHFMPDYNLYNDYIEWKTGGDKDKKKKNWDDYLSYSIGFTTRGCIRHCEFCVNRLSNRVTCWSPVKEFLDESRPKIYLWDDNIMAAPPAVFKRVIEDLKATGKPFQFRQGLDIRLMTEKKAQLLCNVKYHGDYIFAFDHYRMDDPNEKKQVEQTLRGLEIWTRYCTKETKLYVLVAFDSQDEKDIEGTFFRIKKLMEFGCLPYIMRYEAYHKSRFESLYIQLARWCNQPSFFKKMSFRQYCVRNEEYHQGIQDQIKDGIYNVKLVFPDGFTPRRRNFCSCYRAMIEFEQEFPEIAAKYFDLRFEDLKPKDKQNGNSTQVSEN